MVLAHRYPRLGRRGAPSSRGEPEGWTAWQPWHWLRTAAPSRLYLLPPPMSQMGLLAGPCPAVARRGGRSPAPPSPAGLAGVLGASLPSSPEDQRAPGAEPWAQAVFVMLERTGRGDRALPGWAGRRGHHPHPLGQHQGTPRNLEGHSFSGLQFSPAHRLIHSRAGTDGHLLCARRCFSHFSWPPAPRWPLLREVCPALPTAQAGPRARGGPQASCVSCSSGPPAPGPCVCLSRGGGDSRMLSLQRPVLNRQLHVGEKWGWGRRWQER